MDDIQLLRDQLYIQLLNDNDFENLPNLETKIRYIFEKYQPLDMFENSIKELIQSSKTENLKSKEMTKVLIQRSEQYFIANNYEKSLEILNESIFYAEVPNRPLTKSDELYLVYRARSQTFYEMRDWENALYDINICLDVVQRLGMILQKTYCLIHLAKLSEAHYVVGQVVTDQRLRDEAIADGLHERFVELLLYIENLYFTGPQSLVTRPKFDLWLDIRCTFIVDPVKGRYLSSKQFIPENTEVFVEKGTHIVLKKKSLLSYCSNCAKYLGNKFWPCFQCREVVFCDRKCLENGWNRFHRFECGITKLFYSFGFPGLAAFRLFVSTRIQTLGHLCAYKNEYFLTHGNRFIIEDWIRKYAYLVHSDSYSAERVYDEFTAILTYMDNKSTVLIHTQCLHLVRVILTGILIVNTHAFAYENVEQLISFFDFLYSVIKKMTFNAFPCNDSQTGVIFGRCIYIMGCFLNHSCRPNAKTTNSDQFLSLRTLRDINPNEALTICYAEGLTSRPFSERQEFIKRVLSFRCFCELCSEETKTFIAFRCLTCEGPVVYDEEYQSDECMKCLAKYQRIENAFAFVIQLNNQLLLAVNNIDSGLNIEQSKHIIRQTFIQLSNLLYKDCNILTEWAKVIAVILQ